MTWSIRNNKTKALDGVRVATHTRWISIIIQIILMFVCYIGISTFYSSNMLIAELFFGLIYLNDM